MKTVKTIHYCKTQKSSGKPIVVTDVINKKYKNVHKWSMDLFDENNNPVRIEVEFNNSTGKAMRQGATTVLKIIR